MIEPPNTLQNHVWINERCLRTPLPEVPLYLRKITDWNPNIQYWTTVNHSTSWPLTMGYCFPKHLHIHSESDAWSDIPTPGKLKFSMNHYKSPHLENVPGRKHCQYSLLGCRLAESTRHIGFRTNAEMKDATWATGCIPQIPEFRAVTQDRIRVTPLVCSRHNCFLLPPSVQIIWQLKSKFK